MKSAALFNVFGVYADGRRAKLSDANTLDEATSRARVVASRRPGVVEAVVTLWGDEVLRVPASQVRAGVRSLVASLAVSL